MLVTHLLNKCLLVCSIPVILIVSIYMRHGFLYKVDDRFFFQPNYPSDARFHVLQPSLLNLPFENVFIMTVDGIKLHAYFIKQNASIAGKTSTVLSFHGSGGNLGHGLPIVEGFFHLCSFNILMLEYRGYGLSDGSPSEEGLYLDAQAGLKYLLQNPYIDKSKILAHGYSLGGAVVIDLASRKDFADHILGFIVENAFTSIPEICKIVYNLKFLKMMPLWAVKDQFSSIKKIVKVKRPILFISGKADTIIPSFMMKTLFQECRSPLKRFYSFEYGTHTDTWQCKGYFQIINLFVNDIFFSMDGVFRKIDCWQRNFRVTTFKFLLALLAMSCDVMTIQTNEQVRNQANLFVK